MRRSRAVAVVGSIAIVMGAALGASQASYAAATPTTPTAPYTVLSMERVDPPANGGDPTSSQVGTADVLDSGDGTFVTDTTNGQASVSVTTPGFTDSMGLALLPPTGQTLAVGHYTVSSQADATDAGLTIGHQGQPSCTTLSGSVEVEDIAVNSGAHTLTRFAATYDVRCDAATLAGDVRVNSAVPYVADSAAPATTTYGVTSAVDVGQLDAIDTVMVSSLGPTPLVLGSASLGGATPEAFVTGHDACSGVTLGFGQTCTIDVAGRPTAAVQQVGELDIPANSPSGHVVVTLATSGQDSPKGAYYPVTPARILDTRIGEGAPLAMIGAGRLVHVMINGVDGMPASGVSAVVLNVTVTGATATAGYVSAYATGSTRPTASNINYTKGITRAGEVTVPVAHDGQINLYNCCGKVNLIADVEGFYVSSDLVAATYGQGAGYHPAQPERVLDTRDTSTWAYGPLPSHFYASIPVDYGAPWRASTRAFAVTVTAVKPAQGGYLTAYSGSADPTLTSTVNFTAEMTTPNFAIVPTELCTTASCKGIPQIRIFNGSKAATHVVVDIVGFYADSGEPGGLRFHALPPTRIADSRLSLGTTTFGPATTHSVTAPPSVAGYDTIALAANVTAVRPTTSTYLTLWPHYPGGVRPVVSNVNTHPGITVANAALLEVGDNNVVDVYNNAGTTDVVIDVAGTFESYPPQDPHPFGAMAARPAVTASATATLQAQVAGPVRAPAIALPRSRATQIYPAPRRLR